MEKADIAPERPNDLFQLKAKAHGSIAFNRLPTRRIDLETDCLYISYCHPDHFDPGFLEATDIDRSQTAKS